MKGENLMPIKKKKLPDPVKQEEGLIKNFFDMIAPSVIKFAPDHYIVGDTYRCVWGIREYPPTTGDQAILGLVNNR